MEALFDVVGVMGTAIGLLRGYYVDLLSQNRALQQVHEIYANALCSHVEMQTMLPAYNAYNATSPVVLCICEPHEPEYLAQPDG